MTVTIYSAELIFKPLLAVAGFLFAFGCMRAIEEFMKYIDRKMDMQTKDSIIKALESQNDSMTRDYESALTDCAMLRHNIDRALKAANTKRLLDVVVILEEALR